MLVDEGALCLAIWTPYLRDLLDHADDYVKDMHLDPAQEAEDSGAIRAATLCSG